MDALCEAGEDERYTILLLSPSLLSRVFRTLNVGVTRLLANAEDTKKDNLLAVGSSAPRRQGRGGGGGEVKKEGDR